LRDRTASASRCSRASCAQPRQREAVKRAHRD
jgi:hypothetical protein